MMNKFGLSTQTIDQIKSCFAHRVGIKWVKVYGSRALGTYKRGSDIDLAFSSSIDYSAEIAGCLEELPTPYLFDVTYYDNIQNEKLKNHIDRVGVLLFAEEDL